MTAVSRVNPNKSMRSGPQLDPTQDGTRAPGVRIGQYRGFLPGALARVGLLLTREPSVSHMTVWMSYGLENGISAAPIGPQDVKGPFRLSGLTPTLSRFATELLK